MSDAKFTFEGSEEAAKAILNYATSCMNVVSAMKKTLGIDRMLKVFDAPDGSQIHVLDYEYIKRVHIVTPVAFWPDEQVRVSPETPDEVGVADFVSGFVSPIVDREALPLPWDDPNEDTPERDVIRAVSQTEQSANRTPINVARYKLGVHEHSEMRKLPNPLGVAYSEHANIHPGFYSGAMRPLVQVMLGVGKIPQQTYEKRWIAEDEKRGPVSISSEEDLASAFDLYSTTADEYEVKVHWDYRFSRTHGISWGADGKAYVVEIGTRGVFATPLELDPVSVDSRGRARYEDLYPELFDPDGCKGYGPSGSFFDVFGGFPTGAHVSSLTQRHTLMVRAGETVELLSAGDMEEFYGDKQGYSSVLGWAFHPKGGEAHNTCHWREGGNGDHYGFHYCVTISISEHEEPEPAESSLMVVGYLGLQGVRRRKALRMTEEQARSILSTSSPEAAREAFDELTVPAPFAAQGRLRMQKKGRLYGRPPFWLPPFKVPEPLLGDGVVVTFTMHGVPDGTPLPVCDTPIYVCYSGTTLNVVNYSFRPAPPAQQKIINTREPCQVEGEWLEANLSEGEFSAGHFYSNIEDWREVVPRGGQSEKRYSGQEVGRQSRISFNILWNSGGLSNSPFGDAYWITWHLDSYEGFRVSGKEFLVGVTVPFGDRSIYYMAKRGFERERQELSGHSGTYNRNGKYILPVLVVGPYLGSKRPTPLSVETRPFWLKDYATGRYLAPELTGGVELSPEPTVWGPPRILDGCGTDEAISPGDVPYDTRDGRWVPESGVGFMGHNAVTFGPEPVRLGRADWATPAVNVITVTTKIFGDTILHGTKVNDERVQAAFPNDPPQTQGLNWLRMSPDIWGTYTVCAVTLSHFGREPIICYDPDDGEGWRGNGEPESMHAYWSQCYVGYIE